MENWQLKVRGQWVLHLLRVYTGYATDLYRAEFVEDREFELYA